jgi:hypothetical protein
MRQLAFAKTVAPMVALMVSLGGCAAAPRVPQEAGPDAFVIERDLVGETTARGEFSAINGLKRGFTARLTGVREGSTFTLNEKFAYDDGEMDEKTWVLTLVGEGEYTGVREDVVGQARGWQDGNAFRLEYDMRLPGENGEPGMQVRFRDVMVMKPDGAVLNHATVGKWGFQIGKVELEIQRTPAPAG